MKGVCRICGALFVPHEDGDGSWRQVEPHYRACAWVGSMGALMGIVPIGEVPDDWVRPVEADLP